ncbi:MAG: DNA polymerase I, partial [Rhodospirillaceae bacterium]|nr:DNA polymerase I [Rhodospirillaceae bacterium]
FRAYHALPPMTRSDGTPVGAVYGFTKMIMKLVEDTDADAVAVVLDRARKTFRNDIYPEYKAHRPPAPDDLIPQFALVRDAVEAMDLKSVDMEGYEADDLIATYAVQAQARGIEVTIVSSDKDLMQLVGPGITMLDAMKDKIIGPDQVFEKFGVGPERVIDVQALAGDSSDNVPGVAGIGVKTAALLINEYGDLDGVLENAHKVKQNKRRENLIEQAEQARISRDLVTLKKDVPIEMPLDDFILYPADPDKMMSFLAENNFKSLLKKMEAQGFDAPKAAVKNTAVTAGATVKDSPAPATPKQPLETTYELVQDEAALERWVAGAFDAGIVAVDTETTGLDSMEADLVGVSLSYKPGQGAYIPLAHRGAPAQGAFDLGDGEGNKNAGAPKQIEIKKALAILKPLLEDPGVLKVGQNIKYDQVILARGGIDVAPVDDTMVISYVLEGGLHGHGMDELALLHLGVETIKFKDVAGTGKSKVTFDYVSLDKALDYAAEDADITLQLHQLLKPRLVDEHMVSVYENIERPLISVLADMETNGILVDVKILKNLSDDFSKRLGILEKEIHSLAGREFNIASPKQLGEILFDELGLEGGKKSKKTGAWSTGADVLDELSHAHDLPKHVLGWRQLAKLKSTYTDALQNQINPVTGRVHTSYSMAGTSTGRLASSDPNLQNIPIRSEEGRAVRTA